METHSTKNQLSSGNCKLSKDLSKPLYSVNMKDSVFSFTAANTDNKVNKLVTVFALALLRLPGRRTGDKSGSRNYPLNSFVYHDN